ncbi:MAG: ABC transporter ATP-binding protein, partial [Stellaceae bacterium]
MPDSILSVEDVTVRFGGIVALDRVSFAVERGSICGLIGPNGAGKTTLFNCLSRLYQVNGGAIRFEGRDLLAIPRHRIANAGIGRTFQNLALFGSMSARRNVMVGGHCRGAGGFFANALRLPVVKREEARIGARAQELIEALDLADVAESRIADLTFATQKRVELARALAGEPKLLLLDEPAGGLNHEEVDRLRDT